MLNFFLFFFPVVGLEVFRTSLWNRESTVFSSHERITPHALRHLSNIFSSRLHRPLVRNSFLICCSRFCPYQFAPHCSYGFESLLLCSMNRPRYSNLGIPLLSSWCRERTVDSVTALLSDPVWPFGLWQIQMIFNPDSQPKLISWKIVNIAGKTCPRSRTIQTVHVARVLSITFVCL